MFHRKFRVLKPLGEGAYSSVYKVKRYSDQGVYALKKVKLPNLTMKGRTITYPTINLPNF